MYFDVKPFHYMIFVLPNPLSQLARHASIEHDPTTIGHQVNIELFHVPQPVVPSAAREPHLHS